MQRPRQHTIPQRHHHLNHTSHTSRRLRMTNIRLHRPQPQRPTPTTLSIRRDQSLSLNRITQRRTRTMTLNHINLPRRKPRTRQRLSNHPLLRGTVRRRQAIARAVLIHRRPTHQPQHPTTITHRIRQTLQQQHPNTLRKPRAVRCIRERLAPPIHSKPTLTTKPHKHYRRRHHSNPTRQRQRTLTTTQRPTRQMQRHKRRRTRRIHRHRRTLKPQRISHPAGANACSTTS